eukprot:111867_1
MSTVTSDVLKQYVEQYCKQYDDLKQENTQIQQLRDQITKLKREKSELNQKLNESQKQCKLIQKQYDALLKKLAVNDSGNVDEKVCDFDMNLFHPDTFPKSFKECNVNQIICIVESFLLPNIDKLTNEQKLKLIEWFKIHKINGMKIVNTCDIYYDGKRYVYDNEKRRHVHSEYSVCMEIIHVDKCCTTLSTLYDNDDNKQLNTTIELFEINIFNQPNIIKNNSDDNDDSD